MADNGTDATPVLNDLITPLQSEAKFRFELVSAMVDECAQRNMPILADGLREIAGFRSGAKH